MLPLFCSFPYRILAVKGTCIINLCEVDCIASATDTDENGKPFECTDMYMRNGKDYRVNAPLVAVAKKIDELIKAAKSGSKAAK